MYYPGSACRGTDLPSGRILYIHTYVNLIENVTIIMTHLFQTLNNIYIISVLPKGKSFTANSGTKAAILPKGRSSIANFPHPTLSLASEQTLKDLKDPWGTKEEVRRVDLANWALRTSLKFTIGVKYQFHQDFFHQIRDPEIPITLRPYIYIYIYIYI